MTKQRKLLDTDSDSGDWEEPILQLTASFAAVEAPYFEVEESRPDTTQTLRCEYQSRHDVGTASDPHVHPFRPLRADPSGLSQIDKCDVTHIA